MYILADRKPLRSRIALWAFVSLAIASTNVRAADLPARYFQLMKIELAPIEKRLATEPHIDLAALEIKPSERHFPGAILAEAVLYARRHPANTSFGDKQRLEFALRIGDLLAREHEKGTFQKRGDDDWDMYMWLEAYRLLEPELGSERRARWRRELEKNVQKVANDFIPRIDFPRYQGPFIRTSTNHYSLWASTAYLAGRMFHNQQWIDCGTKALHRLASEEQTPDGYWGEHTDNGPTTGYNHLTLTGVALYWEHSGDPAALAALRRATDFHKYFTYADGKPVETINGRNRYWEVSAWGQFAFSNFPDGRRFCEFLTNHLTEGKLGNHALGRIAQDALYYHEGHTEPIPQDQPGYVHELHKPAGIRKTGPWTVCLSGLIDPPIENQFTLDRQGHLSVFHQKLGLIITGANSKRQPELAGFVEKTKDKEFHLPISSRLRMGADRDRLGLAYQTFFAELAVTPPTDKGVELRYTLQETARNRLEDGQLHLQLCLKSGEVLETARKQLVLGETRIELTPEEIGGVVRHNGWTLHVGPTARLTWPILPFNPYRNAPETDLAHAVGVLSTPLRVQEVAGSKFRSQAITFRLEADTSSTARRAVAAPPEQELPYDSAIKKYLANRATAMEQKLLPGIRSGADFEKARPALHAEYMYMLGLTPQPERTPLKATITGKLQGERFTVEKLHFQSSPGLYVTGNLYVPLERHGPAPTILYLCGHASQMKRDGNKAAPECQSHAVWFASHGYVVLVLDTLELGEIAAVHRGTLRLERWWWHSVGYTPAGVECWNAMRALDYLFTRPEVDRARIGVTGISGGGAVSFWVAAADPRVAAAAPVSGMGDVTFYAGEGGESVHCDCITCYNAFRWHGATIAALIAPRPLMFVNSDHDVYFPLPTVSRLQNDLERVYSLFGEGDQVESVLSMGGHGYRTDIRRAVYGFFNRHLKQDANRVTDPDFAVTGRNEFVIPPANLRVFPTDADLPADQLNTRIDESFVTRGNPGLPAPGGFENWRKPLLERLKRVSFAAWPAHEPKIAAPTLGDKPIQRRESTEEGIEVEWKWLPGKTAVASPYLIVLGPGEEPGKLPEWATKLVGQASALIVCPRGIGPLAWTRGVFPNTIERSFPLLGATSDSGRIWDIAVLARRHQPGASKWTVAGLGQAGLIGAYAALHEPAIGSIVLANPPASHQPRTPNEPYGPPILNVLRVLDVPEALGCLAPRPLQIVKGDDPAFDRTAAIYKAAGAADQFKRK
jgi:hypothetical protein